MSNPFSSDYIQPQSTEPKLGTGVRVAQQTLQTGDGAQVGASMATPAKYGFEPERYGLGKPKRLIIRGKISRE